MIDERKPLPTDEDDQERLLADLLMGDVQGHWGRWRIDNRAGAFWAVRKIAWARRLMRDNQESFATEVDRLARWLQRENDPLQNVVEFLLDHLEEFHRQLLEQDPAAVTLRTPWGTMEYRDDRPGYSVRTVDEEATP